MLVNYEHVYVAACARNLPGAEMPMAPARLALCTFELATVLQCFQLFSAIAIHWLRARIHSFAVDNMVLLLTNCLRRRHNAICILRKSKIPQCCSSKMMKFCYETNFANVYSYVVLPVFCIHWTNRPTTMRIHCCWICSS